MLLRKGKLIEKSTFRETRKKFFEPDCMVLNAGDFLLLINGKSLSDKDAVYQDSRGFLAGTGTFSYRGRCPYESLSMLYADLDSELFDSRQLLGHYFIFYFTGSSLKVLSDGASLVKAYHDPSGSFLSSSFLVASSLQERLTINRFAVMENLCSGGITGNETMVNEIIRFTWTSQPMFKEIIFIFPVIFSDYDEPRSISEALEQQSDLLDSYFKSFNHLAEKAGTDIGLTGGYDSRLVLAYARRHFRNFQVHSHYRRIPSTELAIARQIAEGEDIPFVSPKVKYLDEMNDEAIHQVMEDSFVFYDGNIRIHCNWLEEYNTLQYRLGILGNRRLGISGIGGEQYRNQERLLGKHWSFRQWLKYDFLKRGHINRILNHKTEDELLNRIESKILTSLNLPGSLDRMSLADLKKIQNEVIIPACRGARTDAENRYTWFLSPFADPALSFPAYKISKFLNSCRDFEGSMIKNCDRSLAGYTTDYGYDLIKGEPVCNCLISTAFENFLPASVKWTVRKWIKYRRKEDMIRERIKTSPLLQQYVNNLVSLGLPLSVNGLISRDDTAHLAVSYGFVLEKLKKLKDR